MTPLRILYQDDTLVAVDKPAGLLVHPGREAEGPEWIVMKRLRDQLGCPVYPTHRLDRPTSGVLLMGLERATATAVQMAFERREVEKTYLAIVAGAVSGGWRCETPLRKSPDEPLLAACTDFDCLEIATGFAGDPALSLSLLEARPRTGRFHQIRRHLQGAGHPIVGDYRYAGIPQCDAWAATLGTGTRMLLQAKSLELRHPHRGFLLKIEAPADEDFLRCFPGIC